MISARRALFGHIRCFVETELRGLWTYDELRPHVPEAAVPPPGKTRSPFGRDRERVGMTFGDYDLIADSPHEAPPLGEITLRYSGGVVSGPLDPTTWARIGACIRERSAKREALDHGH